MAWSGRFDDFKPFGISDSSRNRPSNNSLTIGQCAKNRIYRPAQNNQATFQTNDQNLSGVTKIGDIFPDMPNVTIVGVVITKDGPKSIMSKKNVGTERHLLAVTVRDAPDGFINVTCWGMVDFINNINNIISLGNVVQIKNAQVQGKQNSANDEQYKPYTPSQCQLNVSENHSQIELYSGWDLSSYNHLLHLPTKPSNDYYILEDINANGMALQGEAVNLLAAVRKVWPAKDITTKTGKKTKKCSVVLFDETCSNFTVDLWDHFADLASTWIPNQTVVFAADVKILYNDFKSTMIGTATSRTVFTIDPDTPEAHSLYQFASSHSDWNNDDRQREEPDPDLGSITQVYNVEQVKGLKNELTSQTTANYGVLYALITTFNIDYDGDDCSIFRNICSRCKREVTKEAGFVCTNQDCSGDLFTSENFDDSVSAAVEYNIVVSLSDNTGTIHFCHLQGAPAEHVLGHKAAEFQQLHTQKKTDVKWNYLLERCKVKFKIRKFSADTNSKSTVRILSLEKADPMEVYQCFC
ncbi:meiosis-specific with OB domain-containing protein-like [Gigantopelta aegis]|uniref:meiosis-specific with OB domain-containing protein-like n=1 Tax=Gigantopelta aegis TaxID=1735272 RepID=UPI001B88942E|nr:meiosis-specific with OB domain-containing protein-like [Gigantopelta aegis]